MFNEIWKTLKARKHYCISWFLVLMTIGHFGHFGQDFEISWYKFFSVFAILMAVEYYAWSVKENK